jgi:hypothetical protein
MNYIRGNCRFSKMDFQILPHVLRVYQPPDCDITSTIDFSRGYPVPWQLEFTDLSVPSQHLQDGRRYDAEIMLHHTYGRNGLDRLVRFPFVFGQTKQRGSSQTQLTCLLLLPCPCILHF